MIDIAEVAQAWVLACEDAKYEPDAQAVLYVVPGNPRNGSAALHVEPGSEVCANTNWPLDRAQIRDANSEARRNIHRIAVRDFASPRIALGRLRHELEHARQYDRCLAVYVAMSSVESAVARAFGQLELPCLDGSGAIYNVLPHEEDANRAAALITEAHFGAPTRRELAGTDAPLFRDTSPIEETTLSYRLLTTAALFPAALEWVAHEKEETIGQLLARFGPDADTAWQIMVQLPEIKDSGQRALESCPTEGEIKSASAPANAWAPVKEEIEAGREDAESALGEALPNIRLH